jgi:ribokinase
VDTVIVTMGARGALLVTKTQTERIAPIAVKAVDTTGAGDAFVGAFAVGLALGRSPVAAVRLGCVAAADSVTRRGTQASYADTASAVALLQATPA